MEFFTFIADGVHDILDAASGFIQRSSKLTLTITGILLFLAVSALCIALAQLPKIQVKKKTPVLPPVTQELPVESFIRPQKEFLTQEYYFSRESHSVWQDEEAKRWFTMPDESTVSELGRANDKAVEKIIGAAP